jgi:5S rRNA maturation endonuclease (ribonuclease M5)
MAGVGATPSDTPLRLSVDDVRSVHGRALDVPLGALTVLVGPNRAGASTVARAFALALDDRLAFEPERDLPRGRDRGILDGTAPRVAVTFADGRRRSVRFDRTTGARTTDDTGPVADAATGAAFGAGPGVLRSLIDDTPRDLLRPLLAADPGGAPAFLDALTERIAASAEAVLGEQVGVEVADDGRVDVRDELGIVLPVPELRALVAIATAATLAARGTPPAGLVVEAPDAFLHPAAQATVATELLAVALDTGVPVVVTTTSPFVLPRREEVRIVALTRDAAGVTRVVASARGDEPQARALGGLLGDVALAAVLDRTGGLDPSVRGVLIVEGGTDVAYLRLAARALGREDVLDGVRLHDSGGAMGAALAAIVLRAESDVPVVVLLDSDDQGARARATLVNRFEFDRQREVMTYADVFEGGPYGVEAETLFGPDLLERFVAERGRGVVSERRSIAGAQVPDLTSSGKSAFVPWVEEHAGEEDLTNWDRLLDRIAERLPG